MRCILGVDFDNTVVNYDDVLFKTAMHLGFIDSSAAKGKKNIRDCIRQLPGGEIKWQKLQAYVYGKAMDEAILIDGVREFFNSCRRESVRAYIVSHKTEFAALGIEKINLRETALNWMRKNNFFEEKGLGISADMVYFEASRLAKIERVKQLGCTHFIDDLEETFGEEAFPANIHKILYSSHHHPDVDVWSADAKPKGVTVMRNWREIYDYFFNKRR